jgi:hypothetical protein
MGVRRIFFSDDNFIGRPGYAKELLRALIPLNNSFQRPLSFFTQLTINVAKDDELLALLADANFRKLLVGIESANPASLREANKPQNYKTDVLQDIRKIHSYGLAIHGQMIVGFDNDGPDVFERTYEFVQQSCIPTIILNLLYALPGTKLWHRLRRERRILALESFEGEEFSYRSNIVFKRMSRAEVFRGFIALYRRIYTPEAVRERMEGMVHQIRRKPRVRQRPIRAFREESRAARGALKLLLFNPDNGMRRVFRQSMRMTLWQAPFMLDRMIGLGLTVHFFRYFIDAIAPRFASLIAKERETPPRLLPDQTVTLPESFRAEYKSIFPSVYLRLASRLRDKSNLHYGLVTAFSDFVERFHEDYDRLGGERYTQLQRICDRVIAKLNDEDPTTSSWPDAPPVRPVDGLTGDEEKRAVREVRLARLDEDILAALEQELHRGEEGAAAVAPTGSLQ